MGECFGFFFGEEGIVCKAVWAQAERVEAEQKRVELPVKEQAAKAHAAKDESYEIAGCLRTEQESPRTGHHHRAAGGPREREQGGGVVVVTVLFLSVSMTCISRI